MVRVWFLATAMGMSIYGMLQQVCLFEKAKLALTFCKGFPHMFVFFFELNFALSICKMITSFMNGSMVALSYSVVEPQRPTLIQLMPLVIEC